jgi:hypothetical protein
LTVIAGKCALIVSETMMLISARKIRSILIGLLSIHGSKPNDEAAPGVEWLRTRLKIRPRFESHWHFAIECGRSRYVCEQGHYVHEPQLRAAWLLRARRVRGDARPDDDDARRRDGERPLSYDAPEPDALVTVPFLPYSWFEAEPTFAK